MTARTYITEERQSKAPMTANTDFGMACSSAVIGEGLRHNDAGIIYAKQTGTYTAVLTILTVMG